MPIVLPTFLDVDQLKSILIKELSFQGLLSPLCFMKIITWTAERNFHQGQDFAFL